LWTKNANESLVPAIEGPPDARLLLPADPGTVQKNLRAGSLIGVA
jgi:hypothetical protein